MLTIRRASRGVEPPHSLKVPSSRTIYCNETANLVLSTPMALTFTRQSKLFRYRVSAPAACILVLMLSSGIVESGKQP